MRLSWRQRLAQQPHLRDYAQWPVIPLDSVPTNRRPGFLRNQRIVAHVLHGQPLIAIASQHHISLGRISQLMNRCLGGQAHTPPALNQGLIPHATINEKHRHQILPQLHQVSGDACAFKAMLDQVPRLKQRLDALIRAGIDRESNAQTLTPYALHGEFKRVLAEAHWPRDQYPYTTQSQAYASVRRYLHQRSDEILLEKAVKKQTRPSTSVLLRAHFRALRATQIDEHTHDMESAVHLKLNDDLIPLRVARMSVLVTADVDTTCALGYYLAPSGDANQQDVLTLIDHCIEPWQPLVLKTPGLRYTPGACFPSGLDEPFPISFGLVQLDNAMVHKAHSVRDLLCEKTGATVNLGLPAMPEIREVVEHAFDYIEQRFGHRVASTTGSHPTDPKKETKTNRQQPPVITFETVNEVLSVLLTEYNITPRSSLLNASPLELYQNHCQSHLVRYVPSFLASQWQPLMGFQECTVHWYQHENRLPFINFYYERYHGPGLLEVFRHSDSKRRKIRVQFSRYDIRTLKAFSLNGEDLGELQVSTPWQRFPHSLATRQRIHQFNKRYRLNARDPLAGYFAYLLENKDKPSVALSLLQVYQEFTGGFTDSLVLGSRDEPSNAGPTSRPTRSKYTWHPSIANHRE